MRHGYIELKRKSTSRKIKERIFLFLLMVGLIQLSFQEIRIIEDYKNLSTFNKLKYLTKQQHHQKYENIDVVEQELKELPICVIVRKDGLELEESINLQNYTNYKIVRVEQSLLFNSLRQIITSNCSNTDIVLLVQNKLKQNAFDNINRKFQTYSIWLWYGISTNYHLICFYASLIQKIQTNYRKGYNNQYISNNPNAQVLALMELSNYHMEQFQPQHIFSTFQQPTFISTNIIQQLQGQLLDVFPYSPMYSLSQSYGINQVHRKRAYRKLMDNSYGDRKRQANLGQQQIVKAIEYRSLLSLPQNHSLAERQKVEYNRKYSIDQYKTELRLCVVILSHNNIQNNRFSQVLESVFFQDYSNYHIVFIDDFSSDKTLQATKFYSKQLSQQFYNKIQFVRNQEQKYATFNINAAAHHHCHQDDILILVDGDDELVGRQVFKLINTFYHHHDNWIVYSNYYSSEYTFGKSKPLSGQYFDYPKRFPFHVVGPVRTFKVSLFLKIRQEDHKDRQGSYLDTLYDDAMQYPMMEMSGIEHVEYIPEICYFYNTFYQGNDDSTVMKQNHRKQVLEQILERPAYQKLEKLE